MTNQQDPVPDSIVWQQSGIIIKALVLIFISGAALLGDTLTSVQVEKVTAIASAVVTIGLSLWIIHNRVKKPNPPIVQKIVPAKQS